jgi:diacylglycerol kinase (ATP)
MGFAWYGVPRRGNLKRRMMVVVRPPTGRDRLEEMRAAVTFEAGDARRCARAAALNGFDVVVAAGGDGTINEVVNGLAAADKGAALGIVPLGTANDFAAGMGLPSELGPALRVAAEGRPELVDVARVNRRCFINVSTGGFGTGATRKASRRLKRLLGKLTYLVTGARLLTRYEPVLGRFQAGGRVVYEGEFMFFAVGNARRTGGGTPLTPLADHGDGKLDLVVVRGGSRLDFLALLPELRAGTHLDNPDVSYFRADGFDVRTREPVAVNADGEPVAGRRFRYDLLPQRLPLILPGAAES